MNSIFSAEPSSTPDRERARLIVEITEHVACLMQDQGITKTDLARKMGKSPAFVTKIMSGTNNFTVSTIADIFFVLGKSAHVVPGPLSSACRPWEVCDTYAAKKNPWPTALIPAADQCANEHLLPKEYPQAA